MASITIEQKLAVEAEAGRLLGGLHEDLRNVARSRRLPADESTYPAAAYFSHDFVVGEPVCGVLTVAVACRCGSLADTTEAVEALLLRIGEAVDDASFAVPGGTARISGGDIAPPTADDFGFTGAVRGEINFLVEITNPTPASEEV